VNYFLSTYTDRINPEISTREFSDSIHVNKKLIFRSKNIAENLAKINSFFFDYLLQYNIPLPQIINKSTSTFVHQPISFFPFRLKILNAFDKRNSRIFLKKEFDQLQIPLFEFYIGEELQHFVSESHLLSFEIADANEIKMMLRIASKANVVLKSFFERRNFNLVEFNSFFGKCDDKIFILGDFSPIGLHIIPNQNLESAIFPNKILTSKQFRKYTDIIHEQLF
jgi:phosphoribosylaminoimidazole-succinocarboxamide synthase